MLSAPPAHPFPAADNSETPRTSVLLRVALLAFRPVAEIAYGFAELPLVRGPQLSS